MLDIEGARPRFLSLICYYFFKERFYKMLDLNGNPTIKISSDISCHLIQIPLLGAKEDDIKILLHRVPVFSERDGKKVSLLGYNQNKLHIDFYSVFKEYKTTGDGARYMTDSCHFVIDLDELEDVCCDLADKKCIHLSFFTDMIIKNANKDKTSFVPGIATKFEDGLLTIYVAKNCQDHSFNIPV